MSRDPIGVWGDGGNMGNEYAYAWNRPLVVGDPLGLQALVPSGPGLDAKVNIAPPAVSGANRGGAPSTWGAPLAAPSKEGRAAYMEELRLRVSLDQIDVCTALEYWIDYLAHSSDNLDDFEESAGDGYGSVGGYISGRPHSSGGRAGEGWNQDSLANGADNYAHYMGILYWGTLGGLWQQSTDSKELRTDPQNAAQHRSELYADKASIDAAGAIDAMNAYHYSDGSVLRYVFGFGEPDADSQAWVCVRHLPALFWRHYFGGAR